jgi:hypothetical protein
MINILPVIAPKVDVLDHPIPPNEGARHNVPLSFPIHFGFLGLGAESKGFPLFLNLASEFSKQFPGKVAFHAVGKIHHRTRRMEMSGLSTKPAEYLLDRAEYKKRLNNLHFVCFPYKRHYELSASGALLDAIAWEKPFIAMKIPIFENLVKRFGKVGYLCENEVEFFNIVENIINHADGEDYMRSKNLLRKVKESRIPESLALKYQMICNRF